MPNFHQPRWKNEVYIHLKNEVYIHLILEIEPFLLIITLLHQEVFKFHYLRSQGSKKNQTCQPQGNMLGTSKQKVLNKTEKRKAYLDRGNH